MELVWAVIPKPSDEEEGESIFTLREMRVNWSTHYCDSHTRHAEYHQTPVWRRPCRMCSSMA
jgi:hypothetical protein